MYILGCLRQLLPLLFMGSHINFKNFTLSTECDMAVFAISSAEFHPEYSRCYFYNARPHMTTLCFLGSHCHVIPSLMENFDFPLAANFPSSQNVIELNTNFWYCISSNFVRFNYFTHDFEREKTKHVAVRLYYGYGHQNSNF